MKLVVGLGNPEKKYEHTRHNVGFRVLDKITNDWKKEGKWQIADSRWPMADGKVERVLFMKPLTFMNNSGEAVKALMQYYKIVLPDVLVIYDDKDLPLGTIRFRTKGSSGGHHGVQSIIDQIGSNQFARLKVGIAPATPDGVIHDTTDYVLAKFSKAEEKQLPEIIERVVAKVNEWISKIPD